MRAPSLLVIAVVALLAPAIADADQPKPTELAERFNEDGRELFGKGELGKAIKKFRAAIAVNPQARYFFNLCFVLNARYQLEAALGACGAVADADGADDRLKARAADLIEVIKKKKAKNERRPPKAKPIKVTDEHGEPVLESKPLPDAGPATPNKNRGPRVATGSKRYPPPVGNAGVRVVVPNKPAAPPRKLHFGILGGFTFASINEQTLDESSDTNTGVTVGGFVATPLSRVFVGQAELVYVQRGGSADGALGGGGSVRFDYLSIPVVGKIQLRMGRTGRLHFDLGLSGSVMVNSSDTMADTRTFEAGWLIGGGFTYHRRGGSALILDLRHESGLTDVDTVDVAEVRNKTWTLRVGFGL